MTRLTSLPTRAPISRPIAATSVRRHMCAARMRPCTPSRHWQRLHTALFAPFHPPSPPLPIVRAFGLAPTPPALRYALPRTRAPTPLNLKSAKVAEIPRHAATLPRHAPRAPPHVAAPRHSVARTPRTPARRALRRRRRRPLAHCIACTPAARPRDVGACAASRWLGRRRYPAAAVFHAAYIGNRSARLSAPGLGFPRLGQAPKKLSPGVDQIQPLAVYLQILLCGDI